MPNNYFQFKKFIVHHDNCAMKVGTDGVLLGAWASVNNVHNVLDVGSGTGIISLMLAQRCNAAIDAIDIDKNAFLQTQSNVDLSCWKDRITVFHSSFQEFTGYQNKKYDLIITNPPFFSSSYLPDDKSRAAARHDDSLSAKDLAKCSSDCLSPDGKLALIIPYENFDAIEYSLLQKSLFINRITRIRSKPGKKFIRVLIEASKIRENTLESELTIETEKRHVYTTEYIELTKDFYLSF